MQTNPSNYYDLLTYGLGNSKFAWQQFVNRFAEKYNDPQTDGFVWDNEVQLDYTYEQIIAEHNIATLPVYTDVDAPALDKALGEFSIGKNAIPTQKHGYPINSKLLRQKMIAVQKFGEAALNSAMRNSLLDLLFDATDNLIKGNRNALTHQRMQVVSTGQFTISSTNNPRGISGITFDFGTTTLTANTTTARWWTSSTHTVSSQGDDADPLLEMKNQIKAYKHLGYPAMQVEMSQILFDDLLTHTAVLKRIGYTANPGATSDSSAIIYAQNMEDDVLAAKMAKFIGAPIKVYDTYASVESFDTTNKKLKTTQIENFAANNIAYVPQGNIGTIKGVQQLVLDDPSMRSALFDNGRTLITQTFDAKTKSCFVQSEMAVLTVPNMPQYMSHKVVTA